jgi:hypothetical protein
MRGLRLRFTARLRRLWFMVRRFRLMMVRMIIMYRVGRRRSTMTIIMRRLRGRLRRRAGRNLINMTIHRNVIPCIIILRIKSYNIDITKLTRICSLTNFLFSSLLNFFNFIF